MPRPRTRCPRPVPHQLPKDDLPQWENLLVEQHGAVDTQQLAAFGITPDAIAANVEAGRWQALLPRVYAVTTGEPPRATWLHGALLYAGPSAVLSHRTAAEEWDMLRVEDGPVHVTVPYRCSAVSQPPHVVVHRSRAFAYIAVHTVPPRTSRADTALDLATAEPTAREAMRCLVGLTTTSGISLVELERQLADRPPYRYRRPLAAALSRMAGGVASVLEDLYALDVELAHGIPPARRQTPFDVDGYTLWEDAVYDHVGVPLTVRLDGRAYHSHPSVAFRDRRRDNAAELAGPVAAGVRLAGRQRRPVRRGARGADGAAPARLARTYAPVQQVLVSGIRCQNTVTHSRVLSRARHRVPRGRSARISARRWRSAVRPPC